MFVWSNNSRFKICQNQAPCEKVKIPLSTRFFMFCKGGIHFKVSQSLEKLRRAQKNKKRFIFANVFSELLHSNKNLTQLKISLNSQYVCVVQQQYVQNLPKLDPMWKSKTSINAFFHVLQRGIHCKVKVSHQKYMTYLHEWKS